MLQHIATISLAMTLSSQVLAFQVCESVFTFKNLKVNLKGQTEVLNFPEKFVNRKLQFSANSSIAGPLQIIRRHSLPKDLEMAVQDLYILSRDSYVREIIFGSGSRNLSYKKLENAPLNLIENSHGEDGAFVEVGVEVITTKKGKKYYAYSTSNDRSSVRTDYGHLVGILETLNIKPTEVKSVDSFHTHPLNLFPTYADKSFFIEEAQILLAENPRLKSIPFEWHMHTAIEFQPYLHKVDVKDWIEKIDTKN